MDYLSSFGSLGEEELNSDGTLRCRLGPWEKMVG